MDLNTPNGKGKTIMDYLPMAARKLGLMDSQPEPVNDTVGRQEAPTVMVDGPIDKKAVERAIQTLKDYKGGKANLETRIVEEERWWKLRHWDVIRGKKAPSGEEASLDVQLHQQQARGHDGQLPGAQRAATGAAGRERRPDA